MKSKKTAAQKEIDRFLHELDKISAEDWIKPTPQQNEVVDCRAERKAVYTQDMAHKLEDNVHPYNYLPPATNLQDVCCYVGYCFAQERSYPFVRDDSYLCQRCKHYGYSLERDCEPRICATTYAWLAPVKYGNFLEYQYNINEEQNYEQT